MPLVRSSCMALVIYAVSGVVFASHFDVYILTGQSNSLGTTSSNETMISPGTHVADAQTHFFWSNVNTTSTDPGSINLYGNSGGMITTLQAQQGDGGGNPTFWGPEFGLARTLYDSGNADVMIIKLSRGGGGNSFWLPPSGHMHNHLQAQLDIALSAIENLGHTFAVKGLMYLQGESNNAAEAAAADSRLQTLISNVQSHINSNYANAAGNMYSVVGEIAASQSSGNRSLTTNLQEALGDSSNQVAFFRTRDQPLKADGIHFGGGAKLEIGRRFADAFNSRTWVEHPNLLAGYSANEGSVEAIPHPIAQGLRESGAQILGVTMEEVNDSGTPAWRILDNSSSSNPEYRQTLVSDDFQKMFEQGWVFKTTVKVVSGGGLALWGVDTADDPGWGVVGANGNLNGFQLNRVNGDELVVGLWQGANPVNLGPGSADQFHTFELRGAAGSRLFDFYIDGAIQEAGVDLTLGSGHPSFKNALVFNSGSTGGTGLEVYWNEVSLFVVPEPAAGYLAAFCGIVLLVQQAIRRTRNGSADSPRLTPTAS